MPTNPRLVAMSEAFAANRAGLDYLDAIAAQEKRSLTADEQTKYDRAVLENDCAEYLIPELANRTERYDAVAAVTSKFVTSETGRASVHANGTTRDRGIVTYDEKRAGKPFRPSMAVEDMGQFALDLGRAKIGRVKGTMAPDAADEVYSRWDVDPSNELGRVVAHGVAADGTAPVTIEGDLIKFVDANRYAVNAARSLPMPDNHAPTFKRPRTTQRTTVAQQVTEGDILSSQRLQNTGDTVTKQTIGGVLSLSEQEIDWTDPAMLGLSIQDLAESYAIASDTVLTAAITAAASDATETILAVDGSATAAQTIAAVAAAAAVQYKASKRPADTIFVDVAEWAVLAALTDTTGRPLFPVAGPYNDAGMNTQGVASFTGFTFLGLNLVVDPNFAVANTFIVAASQLVEFYEQNKGLLSINVPSTLEVQYAYRGYVAANVYAQGLALIEAV